MDKKNTVDDSFCALPAGAITGVTVSVSLAVKVWSYCCLFPVDYIWNIIRGDLEWHDISHRSLPMED